MTVSLPNRFVFGVQPLTATELFKGADMSVFADQKFFMDVSGQMPSREAEKLYYNLILEEFTELADAWNADDRVEIIDACIDLIYVITGLMHAMKLQPQEFWDEVQRSNMSKFFKEQNGSYTCLRRGDGKILKPPSYSPPNLKKVYDKQCGADSGN
jgi:phosphoribosyl-ATP pyrophosphohydrolase